MTLSIPLAHCSGIDELEHFRCGYCNNFTFADPLIHTGGYDNVFCNRIFCGPCRIIIRNDSKYQPKRKDVATSSTHNYQVGIWTKKPVAEPKIDIICPVEGCTQPFRAPFFLKFPPLYEEKWRKILIRCFICGLRFGVSRYLSHVRVCNSTTSTTERVPVDELPFGKVCFTRPSFLSSNACGSPFVITNGVVKIRVKAINRSSTKLIFPLKTPIRRLFQYIHDQTNFGIDNIDIVSFRHCAASQFQTLGDFINTVGSSGDFVLIDRTEAFRSLSTDIRLDIYGFGNHDFQFFSNTFTSNSRSGQPNIGASGVSTVAGTSTFISDKTPNANLPTQ